MAARIKASTIEEYLAALSAEKRTALEKLRKTIRASAPEHNILARSYGNVYGVLGPAWYPIALVLTAVPCAWAGGDIHRRLSKSA